jgi:hypothetical protein
VIDSSASPTVPGAPETPNRGWWVGRRLIMSVLFVIAIVLPGFIVSLGALFFLLSFFQDVAQSRSDLIAGGVFLAIVGGVFMFPGLIFFLRRRRRAAGKLGEPEDAELALEVIPPDRLPTTLAELDAVFGPPVEPPPTAVMLPFSLHSRPWTGRRWWLAPLVFIAAPVWVAIDHHGIRGQTLIWMIGSLVIGFLVGALQFAYVYRRRIVVDDLTVSYRNMFGRTTQLPRTEIQQIALRTMLTRTGPESRMFFLGSSGQSLLRVARFGLTYDQASQLAAVLRVPIDPTWDRPATLERLATEIPGALTWSERHRGLYAALIMIPILGVALLLTLLMHRAN